MKKLIVTIGLSLAFFSAAAMAENSHFQALGNLSSVSTMTDKQLATVEGTSFSLDVCGGCVNLASLTQGNVSLLGAIVTQVNMAGISQSIN